MDHHRHLRKTKPKCLQVSLALQDTLIKTAIPKPKGTNVRILIFGILKEKLYLPQAHFCIIQLPENFTGSFLVMAKTKAKSVGIWIRVSTEDQARGDSPEHHERRARAYAESKDWQVKQVYHL